MSSRTWSHLETWCQMIVGTLLAQLILWLFGVPLLTAINLNIVMFIVSYVRTYTIRRIFNRLRR